MQHDGTRFFRVKAVAERYDVSVHTIYRAIKSGQLDAYKIGGAIRVPEHSLIAFDEACSEAGFQAFVVGDESPEAADRTDTPADSAPAATVTPLRSVVKA
ncbi:helix-turn-helix domain-containing protein [Lentzea cavernae]|uniref:Helix-turn-helix domain-containing protein n=1 Tax=Lentzea cavernae TaxID=2020703 RepID=A0ABQ3MRU0_9PSEU|nr:helix-turn-helix domain-containing protein [Lentzea cavernae]GHH56978.1 hypothetical protein GCM10017774_75790 [Lentzea cavernae]